MLRLLLMLFIGLIVLNIAFKILGIAIVLAFKFTVLALVVGGGIAAFNYVKRKRLT